MPPRCFIIGHPVAHSRSPLIHGAWLADYGLVGSYERVEVAPGGVADFFKRIRAREWTGGNVTVPHKEEVLAQVDRVSDVARMIGAANTVWWEGETLCCDNTDASGFLAHLDESLPGWDARVKTALIIGAGGAARGIGFALRSRGVARQIVVNRDRSRADALAQALGAGVVTVDWQDRTQSVAQADLIVNTTSLGMAGQPALDFDLSQMRPGTIVDDIVYVPLQTPLLAEAVRRGGIPVDGLGMLLHQAVPGFAHWFGVTPKVTPALRAKLEADIFGH